MDATDLARIELTQGHVALVDREVFQRHSRVQLPSGLWWEGRICDLKWKAAVKSNTVYAVHNLRATFELRLHRVIMQAREGQLVDHRDGNGLHNWVDNLRLTDCAGNARNRLTNRGSKSGFKGVTLHVATGKFEAYIKHDGRKHHLGLFEKAEDAARAYDDRAAAVFGEYAKTNRELGLLQ
jgi:hypothetical protein